MGALKLISKLLRRIEIADCSHLLWVSLIMIAIMVTIPTSTCTHVFGTIFNATVNPGETIQHNIVVKAERGDTAFDYNVSISGFGQGPDGANWEIDPAKETTPYSAAKFLKITPTSFHIDVGQSQVLTLEGQIPSDIGSGGRYALVAIKSKPISSAQNEKIGIVLAYQIPVILTLTKGDLIDKGEITAMNLTDDGSGGRSLSIWFKNTGNHHYKARAEAHLKDKNGNTVYNSSSDLSTTSIIPTYTWAFKFPSLKGIAKGAYTVETNVAKSDGTVLDSKNETIEV